MGKLFSFFKWLLIILLVFVLHAYITGNQHIFKTLNNTILKLKLSPSIDDYQIFAQRKVNIGVPKPWTYDAEFDKMKLEEAYIKDLEKYKTVAFLVVKDGKLLYEKFWNNYSNQSYTNSWSMAKSIISIAIGCAIKEGKIKGVHQLVEDFLPQFKGSNLKIEHLLTMSSGINFKEHYMNPYGFAAKALYGNDIKKLLKNYTVSAESGKIFKYLSGNSQLLGLVLEKATNTTISNYVSEKIWKKIGAEKPAIWSLDKEDGVEKAFCCFNSNARDYAKIGQLMLQKGIWYRDSVADTIIQYDYFKQSTTAANINTLEGVANDKYGYQWWLNNYKGHKIIYARGINGQYIMIIPDKNLVMVRLGHLRNETKKNGHPLDFYIYADAVLSLVD